MASNASYRSQRNEVISSESSSSSDDEDQLWKRQKRKKHGKPRESLMAVAEVRPTRPKPVSSSSTNKRKRNNIWGEVVQAQEEEHVAREMTQFDMHRNRERSVESYNYRLTDAQKKSQPLGNPINLGDDSTTRCRRMPAGLGDTNDDSWLIDDTDRRGGSRELRDRLGERNASPEIASVERARADGDGGIQDRLGQCIDEPVDENDPAGRMEFSSSSLKAVTIDEGMHKKEVAGKIAYSLQEPHREMVKTVVYELGVEKAISLWKETCNIENSGGMLVNTGHRRRTPGGIFFYQIKTDRDISKEKKDIIFAMSRLQSKEESKNKRRKRRKKDRSNKADSMEVEAKHDETPVNPTVRKNDQNDSMDLEMKPGPDESVKLGGGESGSVVDSETNVVNSSKENKGGHDAGGFAPDSAVSAAEKCEVGEMKPAGSNTRGGQQGKSDDEESSGSSGAEEDADVAKAIERRLQQIKKEKEKEKTKIGNMGQDGVTNGPSNGSPDGINDPGCMQQGGKDDEMEEGEVSD